MSDIAGEDMLEQMTLETENQFTEVSSPPLPGAQLRAAREASGISIGEVSHALKFSVRQLEALEADDFTDLKGATFIRGFVRSYARYLRLDETPLLAALEAQAPAAIADVQAVEHMGAAMPVIGQTSMLRPVLLVVAVLVLAGATWLFLSSDPGLGLKFAQKETSVAAPEAPASVSNNEVAPVASTPTPLAQAPTPEVLPSAPVNAGDAAAIPALVPPSPDERALAFSFSDASWVEVRDAKQRVIFTGKYPANTQQSVRGRPPFQLVIGNAAAVKLRYEDRNVDLQPYIRAEVARLTLDDNSK